MSLDSDPGFALSFDPNLALAFVSASALLNSNQTSRNVCYENTPLTMERSDNESALDVNSLPSNQPTVAAGSHFEKGVTLGNVTMSHRTREARRMLRLSHSTMIGLPRASALEN
ncbi:hypothetical protein EVAR_9911_1 [Eumeta japonica]|uniref:Uncharacterized protein n=1 Tax=Eumeta variegata TaxID=151549 RepID=A0A4C1TQE7_EUMVA|nr:hypothetical protein EVAR_9911_1 [Eumeta japonica]